jgi:hypothetical protein
MWQGWWQGWTFLLQGLRCYQAYLATMQVGAQPIKEFF